MRILRTYLTVPPTPGGMEMHILRLSQEQQKLGHQVRLAFNRGAPLAPTDIAVCAGMPLFRVRPRFLRDLLFYSALALVVVMRRLRADVVHVHGDWSAFLLAPLIGRLSHADRLVASVHGKVRRTLVWRHVYARSLSKFSLVYCTGEGDAKFLKRLGVHTVRWQPSGIDPSFVANAQRRFLPSPNVVCVANFVPVKNLQLTLAIAKSLPECRFILIGDGPERATLEGACKTQAIANVVFTGRLGIHAIAEHLRAARVFIATSFSEGTPTALLEAMAAGVPVVTSKSNEYQSLIANGENGYIVDDFAPESYVPLLRKILFDDETYLKMAALNRAQGEHFTWPRVAARITDWTESCEPV